MASFLTRTNQNKESTTLLWFDPNIGIQEDAKLTQEKLRTINDFVTFNTDLNECVKFIKHIDKETIFLITSGAEASQLLPLVSNLRQIDSIFIFCVNKERYEYLISEYPKIIGIYVHLDELCSSIQQQIDLFDQQLETFSAFDHHQKSTKDLSKQSAEFLWFQLFHHLITLLPPNQHAKERMIDICRHYYRGNTKELSLIDQFEREYRSEDAIRWYSKQSFVYKLVNKALRTEDLDQLQTFRFFVGDLSKNLAYEQEKILLSNETILTVYRGVKLDKEEFEKLKERQAKIISTNGYFSTTRCRSKAIDFAKASTKQTDLVNVLFTIECHIQQLGKSVTYADIASLSEYPEEEEILFDLNASFRLDSIEEQDSLHLIYMSASKEGEKITKDYINLTDKETKEKSVTIVFGQLLCNLGQYDQSQKYFEELLTNPDGEDIAWIEFNIGKALDYKAQWEQAKIYYNRAYKRIMKAKPVRMKDAAEAINNIGGIFYREGNYSKALDFHQRALKIREDVCPSDYAAIAESLNYIGLILDCQGQYDESVEHHLRALSFREKFYQSDHIDIAASLNNIGHTFYHQGNYDEALKYCQKALKMREKFYPFGHIDTAKSLHSIGQILERQEKYDESLDFHQRALNMREKFYPSGHFHIALSLNNIGSILDRQGQHNEGLEYCQKALEMLEKFYSSDHVSIGHALNSIGRCYKNQSKKQMALDYYQRALALFERLLPPNHPIRIRTENNVRRITGEH